MQCRLRGRLDTNGCVAAFLEERLNLGVNFLLSAEVPFQVHVHILNLKTLNPSTSARVGTWFVRSIMYINSLFAKVHEWHSVLKPP